MNKILRNSFVALMAMLMGNAFGQGTTFDFDNDYATLFPTLAGTSSGSNETYVGDGDFKEATTSTAINGFTVTVSAADEGVKNANRIWSSAPRLRLYSGSLTITGKGIKKIEFTHKAGNFNFTTETGKLEENIWTGEADEVVFKCSKNTQINKIVINGDGGNDNPGSQTSDEAKKVTIAEFNAAAESNDVWYQLTGIVKNLNDGDQYGNFDLEDETGSVYVYGVLSEKGGEKKKFQELVEAKGIKNGDKLTIIGNRGSYNDKIEVLNAYFVSVESGSDTPDPDPQPQVTTATCAEILAGTDGTFYRVTGKCVEIANTTYGNWYLEDATGRLYIYGTLDKEGNAGKNNSIDVWGIEVGDELTVEGERTTYKETVELKNVKVLNIKKAAAEGKFWDFTKWSDATIANLKADAAASKTAGWSDIEKKDVAEADGEPTETSKDNCFWSVAEPNADGTLSANGVVIEELKGLVWNSTYSTARSLAIAVNYPVALSEYAGGAYLWLGGGKKKIPCFTIPDVKAGSTITMEVESHKASDARGVELYTGVDADGLVDAATKIGDSFTPTTKDSHTWTIDADCDVIVYNTNGCHIYSIKVEAGSTGISTVKAQKTQNNVIYNLAGQKVGNDYKGIVIMNGKKFMQK